MTLREVVIQFNSRFDPRGLLALITTMNKAETEAEQFERALARISQAIIAVGSAGVLAFKNYEAAMTEFAGKAMNTADEFARKFEDISGKISRDTGLMRREVLRGLQESTSALLGPHDAAILTRKAAILSAGNQARMAQAMSVALSGYRNKFGKPQQVLDYTYASAQLGQGQVAEFAPAWQYVLGFARGAGLELKEVAAGIAAISATAPSPLMGSTQFGAFLTGIARGSTYEDKLIQGSGKTSQDLRDMLRQQGLAHTVEFLASKFNGDELQQVFGRKEFVQFVQGTTGRRGILAKLEKLIVENAESGPIEKFGEDLTWTLQNKWDQFIQTFIQMGSEYGKPLATLAKLVLEVGQKVMEVVIKINELTGGIASVVVTMLGGATLVFAMLDRVVHSFAFGVLGKLTGLTNVFWDRWTGVGAAGFAAPKGERWSTVKEAAAHAGADAAAASATRRTAASSGGAAGAGARAAAGAGVGSAAGAGAKARAGARARAAADAASSVGEEAFNARFDTGAKEWNDARRAKQASMYEWLRREAEKEAAADARNAFYRNMKERKRRTKAGESNKTHFGFEDPRWAAHFEAERKRNRHRFYKQAENMNDLVDRMVKGGHIHRNMKNAAMHSLMTIPQVLNDYQVWEMDKGFTAWDDVLAKTGYSRLDPNKSRFGPKMTKSEGGFSLQYRHQTGMWGQRPGAFDSLLYKPHRGHGATLDDITRDMVMKSKMGMFDVASAIPWLAPDIFHSRYRQNALNYMDPFKKVDVGKFAPNKGWQIPSLRWHSETLLGHTPHSPLAGKPRPGWRTGHIVPGFLDMLMMLPMAGKGIYDWIRDGSNYKFLGKGGLGTGFREGMSNTGFNDFLGMVTGFNLEAEKKGQKGMRENIAKMAFFMGKFWRYALSPWALIPAAVIGTWLGARAIFNRTERGKEHLELMKYRDDALFNTLKILFMQQEQAWSRYFQNKAGIEARNPDPKANPGERNLALEYLQDPWGTFKRRLKEVWYGIKKQFAARLLLMQMDSGDLTMEEFTRTKATLDSMGLKDAIPYNSIMGKLLVPNSGKDFQLVWEPDHDKVARLITGKISASEYADTGREPIFGRGIHAGEVKGIPEMEDLFRWGPAGARLSALERRDINARAGVGQGGYTLIYIPVDSVLNVEGQGEGLQEIVEEQLNKHLINIGRTIVNQTDSNVAVEHTHPPASGGTGGLEPFLLP